MSVGSTLRLGIDLGGTKTEAVVVQTDPSGLLRELVRERIATPKEDGYEAIVASTARIARAVAERAGVELSTLPVGIGMPGGIVRRTGLVKNSNTTCLNGRPFREDLSRALGFPVVFENDANCFALAEATHGAARAYVGGVVFGVIIGTGVGGGVVIRGAIHGGPQGIAGEWGHHGVWAGQPEARLCYCGSRGCVEAYASGPALEAEYLRRTGVHRSLSEIALLAGRDADADAVLTDLHETFGRGLANVIDVVDPDAIVIGGGVSNLPSLYTIGRERVAAYVFNDELSTPLLKNELGDSAGVLGAALLTA